MAKYRLAKAFESFVEKTENVLAVAEMFGLEIGSGEQSGGSKYVVLDDVEVRIEPGWVVYITGGSGTGKTTVLQLLKEKMDVPELEDIDETLCSEEVIDLSDVETTRGMKPDGAPFIPRDHSGNADPLRGWKMSAWDGGSRVPCLMR